MKVLLRLNLAAYEAIEPWPLWVLGWRTPSSGSSAACDDALASTAQSLQHTSKGASQGTHTLHLPCMQLPWSRNQSS